MADQLTNDEELLANENQKIEDEIQKKLHMKPVRSDEAAKSSESSSESDQDVDMVMAILTPEFGDDFHCTANVNCQYEDPKSHPKGT